MSDVIAHLLGEISYLTFDLAEIHIAMHYLVGTLLILIPGDESKTQEISDSLDLYWDLMSPELQTAVSKSVGHLVERISD